MSFSQRFLRYNVTSLCGVGFIAVTLLNAVSLFWAFLGKISVCWLYLLHYRNAITIINQCNKKNYLSQNNAINAIN